VRSASGTGRKLGKDSYGYLFIAPFFIVLVVFNIYPVIYTFYLSFQKWDGLTAIVSVGLNNFRRLITDKVFFLTIWNTFRIWILTYIPQILAALLLSALFTLNRIRGMKFLRAVYYLPNLITAASVGLLFNLLMDGDKSALNHILVAIGVNGAPFKFFDNPPFVSGAISYIQWWLWFGYATIIVMAGVTTIDRNIYEVAMVDGAGKMKIFMRITVPLIRPTLVYLTITSIIGGMQLFDVPATLTNGTGDPQKVALTTSMYIYNQSFKNHNFGYASAVSMGLFGIIALLSLFAFRLLMKRKESDQDVK